MPNHETLSDLHSNFLRSVLSYDATSGEFIWKYREDASKRVNSLRAGKVAGTVRPDGYVAIKINKRLYLAHRLAWLFVYKKWPPEEIDHIDGDPNNNRIANLRLATRQENNRNVGLRKDNSTGIKGVYWYKPYEKFHARIQIDGKGIHLGYFETLEEATAARHAAEIKYYGNFRRVVA
jgi:hypothetical protein